MDGWNTIVSFWGPAYVQGLWLLVSGSVIQNNSTAIPCQYVASPGSAGDINQKYVPWRCVAGSFIMHGVPK